MEIQWPLVLFSLLAGTGGSLFAFVGLSEFLGGSSKVRDAGSIVAIALIVLGGCFSVLHLASPLHAISAVTNLLSFSGISIELMLLGANFVVMLAYILVRKRSNATTPVKVLAVLGIAFGLMLGFFCGHGYVIDAQPTWNSETLPLAYLGTSLACGAFLYGTIVALKGDEKEFGGKLGVFTLGAAIVGAIGLVAYVAFLGIDAASSQALVLWGGVVVLGIVATLVISGLGAFGGGKMPAIAVGVSGLACAFVGGLAVRSLMWLCATGYIDLFSHTVPSVMMNI
ncbi:dimethyl sulfoxide reductase anchor subunit family protein [Slackia piriformis]